MKIDEKEVAEAIVCSLCEKNIAEGDETEVARNTYNGIASGTYCGHCYQETFRQCENCNEVIRRDLSFWGGNEVYCKDCWSEEYFECRNCGDTYSNSDCSSEDGDLCTGCGSDDNEGETATRRYSTLDEYVVQGKRAYSCEIECYYPNTETQYKVFNELPIEIGIADDGSLGSDGKEFQTPKLSGVRGADLLKNLCTKLVKNKYYVDKTCGLHIHLDTSDYEGNANRIKKLMLFYLIFEPVLYSYLPYSRRVNHFCMPLSKFYHEQELKDAMTVSGLETIWYREQDTSKKDDRKSNKYDSTRYAGANFHSLFKDGHLEIRHHSGTVDYEKIRNWIDLHLAILELCRDTELETILEGRDLLDLEQKQEKMFELLNLSKTTKGYFIARNNKFGKANETMICAE